VLWSYCKCELFIANAFTPNGDGVNEKFGPTSTCQFLEYHFMIFDRWGQMVFESFDQLQWWNGAIGREAPKEDVYAWELYWTYPNQEAHHKAGRVSLIR
jgi:gliding motility-associated-like protein